MIFLAARTSTKQQMCIRDRPIRIDADRDRAFFTHLTADPEHIVKTARWFTVPAKDKFTERGEIPARDVVPDLLFRGFAFQPEASRIAYGVPMCAQAEFTGVGAPVCEIDIKRMVIGVRNGHFTSSNPKKRSAFALVCARSSWEGIPRISAILAAEYAIMAESQRFPRNGTGAI